jgi:tripartite-type tricarboxylate transporter receptor subunit TctC
MRSRSASLPDVPTYEEAGFAGLVLDQWLGLFAPAGTPREAIQRMNLEVGKALADPSIRERFAQSGLEPVGGSTEQFAKAVPRGLREVRQARQAAEASRSIEP